ncbi:hypothetical protein ACIP9X_21275 [Arthrobacter sp. NPDC093125]|uniref:hypothetical protein n=1 Tax=Arthrobacter sp. NPDC093125 TaxID=3363944 RepID=UPI0038194844
MKHPMAEVPAASKADADDLNPDPASPPAQPAVRSAGEDGQVTGGPAGVLGSDSARIGNWPDPM